MQPISLALRCTCRVVQKVCVLSRVLQRVYSTSTKVSSMQTRDSGVCCTCDAWDAGSDSCWIQPQRTPRLILKQKEPGEGAVHVSVKMRRSVQQHQPDLVALLHADDDHIGGGGPVRDALCPHSGDHCSVLHNHYGSLSHQTLQVHV